ncbi:unnamed protein product [Soboliphyme baturini]|uniref:HMG box domain-containing protein n=1 Tax=Soboliphyme baturini TaxID=241478 RepID=A0A183IHR0_9BILA|nr:unnamed protein product [Soboliphyme baturini]
MEGLTELESKKTLLPTASNQQSVNQTEDDFELWLEKSAQSLNQSWVDLLEEEEESHVEEIKKSPVKKVASPKSKPKRPMPYALRNPVTSLQPKSPLKRKATDDIGYRSPSKWLKVRQKKYLHEEDTQDSPAEEEDIRRVQPLIRYPLPENWQEPKKGWEDDPNVIKRREKDLAKGYNTEAYKMYRESVPRDTSMVSSSGTDTSFSESDCSVSEGLSMSVDSDQNSIDLDLSSVSTDELNFLIDDEKTYQAPGTTEDTLTASQPHGKGPVDFSVLIKSGN